MPNAVAQSDQSPTLVEIGRRIDDVFTQQLARIIFHQNSTENEYRVREKRFSTLMLDKSISDEKHLEYAHAILKLIEGYKVGLIQPLQERNFLLRNKCLACARLQDRGRLSFAANEPKATPFHGFSLAGIVAIVLIAAQKSRGLG